ncbi:hypothetical protein A3Q56_06368 [Intoshia linei]|uniref:Uncharacterized protein n=1 Tax=Intoshia linei TaxID=1819745 RepID=A0A177AVA0_9BILA|nr:hypothetical protein A3Q56_06368 [Intoshia linei]
MAKYDLPAMLDYVMKLNNIDKIDYIGHSQGTIILFILLSIKPEWNDKIIKHYALAPVATLRSLNSIFVTIFKHEFLKNIYIVDSVLTLFCKFISHRLCSFSINAVCGDDDKCFKKSDISYILKHSPAGTSFKNMKHYLQVYENNGIFQPFDNGCAKNKIIYNSCKIPPYNYSNIKVKTVVYVGTHDDIANPENIEILEGILPNIIKTRVYQNWNHIHFNWGADCNLTLHKNIISDIEN